MRYLALLAAFALTPAAAQDWVVHNPGPPPGTVVERVTLQPGDSAVFTLAPGNVHQLLKPAASGAAGAITIDFQSDASGATLTATSHAAGPMRFSVLGDADGSGAYKPLGEIPLPNDGSIVTKHWPMAVARVNVGSFIGGPYGAGTQHRY